MTAKKALARQARRRARKIKKLKRSTTALRYVEHTRYGNRPIISGEYWSLNQIRQAYWGYNLRRDRIFPETAITADLSRQNYGYSPRRVYVDMEMTCRTCRRKFLFFALEQKHWFEELGFFCDAQCHHCQDCRHKAHREKRSRQDYDALIAKPEKTPADWARLETLGSALWEAGAITKPGTLLKSRMPKRLWRR